jgi:WXXGXW repeat (2 copies)
MDIAARRGNRGTANWMASFIGASLLVAFFLFSGTARAQISVGIQIGAPPPLRTVAVLPPSPGADFAWVEGYWYPVGKHYKWHAGYWTRPPYAGAHWVAPHHDGERYFAGYWDGDRGRLEHDHHWDRDHDRDRDRYQDRDEHHDGDEHHDRDDHR